MHAVFRSFQWKPPSFLLFLILRLVMSDAEIKTMLRRQVPLEEQANFSRAMFFFFFFQIYQVQPFSLQRSPQKGSISLFGSPSRNYLGHVLHVFSYHWYCHPL